MPNGYPIVRTDYYTPLSRIGKTGSEAISAAGSSAADMASYVISMRDKEGFVKELINGFKKDESTTEEQSIELEKYLKSNYANMSPKDIAGEVYGRLENIKYGARVKREVNQQYSDKMYGDDPYGSVLPTYPGESPKDYAAKVESHKKSRTSHLENLRKKYTTEKADVPLSEGDFAGVEAGAYEVPGVKAKADILMRQKQLEQRKREARLDKAKTSTAYKDVQKLIAQAKNNYMTSLLDEGEKQKQLEEWTGQLVVMEEAAGLGMPVPEHAMAAKIYRDVSLGKEKTKFDRRLIEAIRSRLDDIESSTEKHIGEAKKGTSTGLDRLKNAETTARKVLTDKGLSEDQADRAVEGKPLLEDF